MKVDSELRMLIIFAPKDAYLLVYMTLGRINAFFVCSLLYTVCSLASAYLTTINANYVLINYKEVKRKKTK